MVAKFRKKRKEESWRDLGFAIFLVVLVVFVVGFLIYQNSKLYRYRINLTSRVNSLQEELQRLEEKKRLLEAGISDFEKERMLREEGLYQKEGENVVAFVLPEIEENAEEQKNPWNPKSWWGWLREKLRD